MGTFPQSNENANTTGDESEIVIKISEFSKEIKAKWKHCLCHAIHCAQAGNWIERVRMEMIRFEMIKVMFVEFAGVGKMSSFEMIKRIDILEKSWICKKRSRTKMR